MYLVWTLKAIQDLQEAGSFISSDNPEAAQKMAVRVKEAAEYLIEQLNMGRPGRIMNTRELVVSGTPFSLVYWVRGGEVQILRMLHHAQKWP